MCIPSNTYIYVYTTPFVFISISTISGYQISLPASCLQSPTAACYLLLDWARQNLVCIACNQHQACCIKINSYEGSSYCKQTYCIKNTMHYMIYSNIDSINMMGINPLETRVPCSRQNIHIENHLAYWYKTCALIFANFVFIPFIQSISAFSQNFEEYTLCGIYMYFIASDIIMTTSAHRRRKCKYN